MNIKKKAYKKKRIGEKTKKIRDRLWPNLDEADLWVRTKHDGYTTIPRTLPLIFRIMDNLSNGKPLSSTYFALWSRVFDENMVIISNPRDIAFEVGFESQRAESTWLGRMKKLKELGFIDSKPGPTGDFNYVLIFNPYKIIKDLHNNEKVPEKYYNALFARAQDIGANDLE